MLVPFEMALDAGAGSVMTCYAEIDGIPATANAGLLTRVLRDELGFAGTTVSDYWAIAFLEATQHIAATPAAAAALALLAGVDVELPDTRCYAALPELVRAGEVPEALLDAAAARVLGHKLDLGLLDADWSPVPPAVTRGRLDLDPPANRALARRVAENSIILLSNRDGALPLRPAQIALIGPCADDAHTFFGCYSYPNHVLPAYPELDDGIQAPTLREALAAELPASRISYRQGCSASGTERDQIADAVATARTADVCILAVGDRPGMFGHGTSGEGCDVRDLTLPGVQSELTDAVLATGTPTVLVVISGRPYALGRYAAKAAATVQAFLPGEEGGPALAGVISGRVNPSGKLPVQVAGDPGINPATYLHPALGGYSHTISSLDPTPMFPFGHGLSYTTFRYSDLRIGTARIPTDGAVTASVTVTNTGDRAGAEVIQLYFRDPIASVTRPVRQLLGFARLHLEPGQAGTACLDIHADRFAFVSAALDRVVEPGTIELHVGSSSTDIRSTATLELQGPARTVRGKRQLFTGARVLL
jgi:beta-glucosidase